MRFKSGDKNQGTHLERHELAVRCWLQFATLQPTIWVELCSVRTPYRRHSSHRIWCNEDYVPFLAAYEDFSCWKCVVFFYVPGVLHEGMHRWLQHLTNLYESDSCRGNWSPYNLLKGRVSSLSGPMSSHVMILPSIDPKSRCTMMKMKEDVAHETYKRHCGVKSKGLLKASMQERQKS